MTLDVSRVHPTILLKLNNFILPGMAGFGKPMRVCQATRTAQEQHELWRQGRETPGKIVTNCDGYTTPGPHQIKPDGYGHAVDCCFTSGDPFDEHGPWNVFGAMVTWCGLKWGGNWTGKLVDRPHIELPL